MSDLTPIFCKNIKAWLAFSFFVEVTIFKILFPLHYFECVEDYYMNSIQNKKENKLE